MVKDVMPAKAKTNGHAPALAAEPAAVVGRRLPKRIVTIQLPEPYDEFEITAWCNYPRSFFQDWLLKTEEQRREIMCQIVLGHNLVDFDGADYPSSTEPAFWEQIPTELSGIMLQAIAEQYGKLPNPTGGR